jgi:CRP/FNR family transcriptional regulator, cyclic AMP receptor protein
MGDEHARNGTGGSKSESSTVRLLAVARDLADFIAVEEREQAERIALPVREVSGPVELAALFRAANAFASLVVDGMLLYQMRIGEQPGLRVVGPGEIVSIPGAPRSTLVDKSSCRAVGVTQLAFLGVEFLAAARRWPSLIAGLQSRTADGTERLATQLAICQLPRVQDRLLAMLWLLAESWGHVTASGTTLSLSLTHESLGALVGARRPTVTLALRELAEQGALVHQDRGWLLLQAPEFPPAPTSQLEDPEVLDSAPSSWAGEAEAHAIDRGREGRSTLIETLGRLRQEHSRNAETHRAILEAIRTSRELNEQIRVRIERQRIVEGPPGLADRDNPDQDWR